MEQIAARVVTNRLTACGFCVIKYRGVDVHGVGLYVLVDEHLVKNGRAHAKVGLRLDLRIGHLALHHLGVRVESRIARLSNRHLVVSHVLFGWILIIIEH